MASYFVDSSALLKGYDVEAGSYRVFALMEGLDRLFVVRNP